MKKLLLTIFFPLFFGAASQAQSNYDLVFDFKLSEDSLRVGDTATLSGTVVNNGPNTFSGTINFNGSVFFASEDYESEFPLDDDNKDFVLPGASFTKTIPPLGTVSFNGIPFIVTDFWKNREDSTNIVIVWPSDGYKDDNNENNYSVFTLYIIPDSTTGIEQERNDISLFSLYPNPAKNEVKISFETVRKGQISLTDITGKTLLTKSIGAGSKQVTLPLNNEGKALAEGIYFISIQTDNQRVVKKLYITR